MMPSEVSLNTFLKSNENPESMQKWKQMEIGELVKEFQSGFACSKSHIVEKGTPHLRPNNIGYFGKLNFSHLVFLPPKMVNLQRYSLKTGDVLFNNTNSKELVGRASLVKEDYEGGFSNHITRLRVDTESVTPEWLVDSLNFLWSEGYFLKQCRKWIGQAGINTQMLKIVKIPVPPLDVQKRIVARVEQLTSRIDQAKKLKEEAMKDTEAIMQAALQRIIIEGEEEGWGWKTLGDTLESVRYGISKKANDQGKGYPIIRMININKGIIDYNNMKSVELEKSEASKYVLKIGDILINRTNSYELVGKSGLFDRTDHYVFASYLIRLRIDETKAEPAFINWIINSKVGKDYVSRTCRRAIQQANINAEEIKRMPIPLPPLERQKQVTAFLNSLRNKTEDLRELQTDTNKGLRRLTQAVLRMAFSGKL